MNLYSRATAEQVALWRALKERLLADDPGLAEDEDALLDTLDGATSVFEIVEKVGVAIRRIESYEKACREHAAEITERARAHAARADRMRTELARLMSDLGINRAVKGALATVSPLAGRIKCEINVEELPQQFKTPRTVWEPKRAEIEEALKLAQQQAEQEALAQGRVPPGLLPPGAVIPGAALVQGPPSIAVRVATRKGKDEVQCA